MPEGVLEVLNVGMGDLKLSFDRESEEQRDHAQKTIEDLLRQGYAIMVEVAPGEYQRAQAFDPERDSYVIHPPAANRRGRPAKNTTSATKRVPLEHHPRTSTRATAIARSAGG